MGEGPSVTCNTASAVNAAGGTPESAERLIPKRVHHKEKVVL